MIKQPPPVSRWSDLCRSRGGAAAVQRRPSSSAPQPRPRRGVAAPVYRGYNESMAQRSREYLHEGDEPIGDYLYEGEADEQEEDEEAQLEARLRASAALGKKATHAAMQRAYTSGFLPPRYIGALKLVATKGALPPAAATRPPAALGLQLPQPSGPPHPPSARPQPGAGPSAPPSAARCRSC
jgi:hypothetical protein